MTILLHGKETLDYEEIQTTLLNGNFRKEDRKLHMGGDLSKVLFKRGRKKDKQSGPAKGVNNHFNSKSRGQKKDLDLDECGFCHEMGY